MTTPDWNAVWTVLVRECGAREDGRADFLCVAQGHYDHWAGLEFRFMGALGFGGKLYADRYDGLRVGCYPEDETPARRGMIRRANVVLREVWR